MSLGKKTILINMVLALTLIVESHFYPPWAIASTAGMLFPVANVVLAIKAWKHRARSRRRPVGAE
jgi:hypothetical protein